jgi:hypothetical protein
MVERRAELDAYAIRSQVHALRWARARTDQERAWEGDAWLRAWHAERCGERACGRLKAPGAEVCWHHRRAEACASYDACGGGGDRLCSVCGDAPVGVGALLVPPGKWRLPTVREMAEERARALAEVAR